MANNGGVNPLYVDGVGVLVPSGTNIQITGIGVRAQGDNWTIRIRGTGASSFPVIFDQGNNQSGNRGGYFPVVLTVEGIYVESLNNLTNVLIYTKSVPV